MVCSDGMTMGFPQFGQGLKKLPRQFLIGRWCDGDRKQAIGARVFQRSFQQPTQPSLRPIAVRQHLLQPTQNFAGTMRHGFRKAAAAPDKVPSRSTALPVASAHRLPSP